MMDYWAGFVCQVAVAGDVIVYRVMTLRDMACYQEPLRLSLERCLVTLDFKNILV